MQATIAASRISVKGRLLSLSRESISSATRLADGAVEAELGAVVGEDGVEVVGPGLGQGLDRLEDLDRPGRPGQAGPAADVGEVQLQRLDRLGDRLRAPPPSGPAAAARAL